LTAANKIFNLYVMASSKKVSAVTLNLPKGDDNALLSSHASTNMLRQAPHDKTRDPGLLAALSMMACHDFLVSQTGWKAVRGTGIVDWGTPLPGSLESDHGSGAAMLAPAPEVFCKERAKGAQAGTVFTGRSAGFR
jgi:hypothetical protein